MNGVGEKESDQKVATKAKDNSEERESEFSNQNNIDERVKGVGIENSYAFENIGVVIGESTSGPKVIDTLESIKQVLLQNKEVGQNVNRSPKGKMGISNESGDKRKELKHKNMEA